MPAQTALDRLREQYRHPAPRGAGLEGGRRQGRRVPLRQRADRADRGGGLPAGQGERRPGGQRRGGPAVRRRPVPADPARRVRRVDAGPPAGRHVRVPGLPDRAAQPARDPGDLPGAAAGGRDVSRSCACRSCTCSTSRGCRPTRPRRSTATGCWTCIGRWKAWAGRPISDAALVRGDRREQRAPDAARAGRGAAGGRSAAALRGRRAARLRLVHDDAQVGACGAAPRRSWTGPTRSPPARGCACSSAGARTTTRTFYEIVEACGATVVAEDHCWGNRAGRVAGAGRTCRRSRRSPAASTSSRPARSRSRCP